MAGTDTVASSANARGPGDPAADPGAVQRQCDELRDFIAREATRCSARRTLLFGDPAHPPPEHDRWSNGAWRTGGGNWALALSGGGIRSATFCLGVLQALARPRGAAAGLPPSVRAAPDGLTGLLAHFDYVSSVSGGGFVAGFMQSLFIRKGQAAPRARAAYAHLADEPPGRVRGDRKTTPLAWLRENGRYLAPSGAGDLAYAIGFSVRNWIGIQLAFGAVILFVLAVATLAGLQRAAGLPSLDEALVLPLLVAVCWLLPVAGAYWMTRDIGAGRTRSLPWTRLVLVAAIGAAVLAVGLAPALGPGVPAPAPAPGRETLPWPGGHWRLYCTASGAVVVQAVAWALAARFLTRHGNRPSALAVALTRGFTNGLLVLAALLALGLVWHVSDLLAGMAPGDVLLASGGGLGIFAAAYHMLVKVLPFLRGPGSGLEKNHGVPRRALGTLLSALGLLLLFAAAVFWTTAAMWLMDPDAGGADPGAPRFDPAPANAAALAVLSGMFVLLVGAWSSFLNMSSYHYFYSARLTRAYLGGANPARTTAFAAADPGQAGSATEPHPGDEVAYADYHDNPEAPLHLINITLNQTVAPGEQLVQHDRKGIPFVVLPGLDGAGSGEMAFSFGDRLRRIAAGGRMLSIGDWLAISGAAVSTGLGRQTSIGASVCATFANARIGRWWPVPRTGRRSLGALFPTYACLWSELRGKFHGANRDYLYLTDGGHFDNTGTYELLRRVVHRDSAVRFILMCDCGADPDYRYADLANLVRIARIDFRLEIEVDQGIVTSTAGLGDVFGTPETMRKPDAARLDNRCALLLDVRLDGRTQARIVMVKPRLIRCASSDLLAFYHDNARFPQQSTGDQFFEEEQWESYRKLGVECCNAVLALGEPLWQYVLEER